MIKLLFLMTGGALGTLTRYAASGLAHRLSGSLFPVGTLLVNSAGSIQRKCFACRRTCQ